MKAYDSHYINGAWVKAQSSQTFAVHDSTTEEVIATVPQGNAAEAEQAVLAARAAFDGWSQTPLETRCALIDKVVEGLKARAEEMALAIAREVGMPIKLSRMVQVGGPVFNWGNAAKVARSFAYEEKVGHSMVVREPIGVVGCITPWNFPLNQITLKVAPALAAGCTVVLKPSEIAPVNAMILTEIIHEAGLPAGVFNLVNGAGLPASPFRTDRWTDARNAPAPGATRRRNADLCARIFEYVRVRSPFNGTELVLTGTNPNDGRTQRLVPPFNRLSTYREPGRINVNRKFMVFYFRAQNAVCQGRTTNIPQANEQNFHQLFMLIFLSSSTM